MILELIGIIYWKMVEKNYGLMTIDRVKKTRDLCIPFKESASNTIDV